MCRRERGGETRIPEKELACDSCVNKNASAQKVASKRAEKEEDSRFERQLQQYLATQVQREEEETQRRRAENREQVSQEMKEHRLKKERAMSAL